MPRWEINGNTEGLIRTFLVIPIKNTFIQKYNNLAKKFQIIVRQAKKKKLQTFFFFFFYKHNFDLDHRVFRKISNGVFCRNGREQTCGFIKARFS